MQRHPGKAMGSVDGKDGPSRARGVDVRPTPDALGAEIFGIDLAADMSDHQLAAIRRAYLDHGVLFFRDQALTPAQHLAFALRFGPIHVSSSLPSIEGHPLVAEVRKEPDQRFNIGGGWHTDSSYDVVPTMGSVLYARELPARGGDTLFASMYRAYDGLSDGMKRTLEDLRTVHSSRNFYSASWLRHVDPRASAEFSGRLWNASGADDVTHPVVIRHPESGRKALYVNPGYTVRFVGWTRVESAPLLEYLYRHATRPEFTTRFHWREGSIAFWDNRATWHYALNDYPGARRVMHRVTIAGAALE